MFCTVTNVLRYLRAELAVVMVLGLVGCSVLRAGPDPNRHIQSLDVSHGDAYSMEPGEIFSDSTTIVEVTDGPLTIESIKLIESGDRAAVLGYRLFKNHPVNLPDRFEGFPARTTEDGVGAPDAIGATLNGPGPEDPTPDGRARTGDYTLVIGYRAPESGHHSRSGIELTVRFRGQSFKVLLHSFLDVCVGNNMEAVESDHAAQPDKTTFDCVPKAPATASK